MDTIDLPFDFDMPAGWLDQGLDLPVDDKAFQDTLAGFLANDTLCGVVLPLEDGSSLSPSCSTIGTPSTMTDLWTPELGNATPAWTADSATTIDPTYLANSERGSVTSLFPITESDVFTVPMTSPVVCSVETSCTGSKKQFRKQNKPTITITSKVTKQLKSAGIEKDVVQKRYDNALAQAKCRQRKRQALDSALLACQIAESKAQRLESLLLDLVGAARLKEMLKS